VIALQSFPARLRALFQKHKLLFIAAGYLLFFALGVLYLRVTASVPLEGDDRLTINGWLYDFERMPFWKYVWQDLLQRLNYFLLRDSRFFPFHYPSAFSLLFFGSLVSYRLYIIAVTALAAFLLSRVARRVSGSERLALAVFALCLLLAPIFNEGMYSYYAVPQKCFAWAAAGWLCLLHRDKRRGWAVPAGLLTFLSCGTYEIGYVLSAAFCLFWLALTGKLLRTVRDCFPLIAGTIVCFLYRTAASVRLGGSDYSGTAFAPDLSQFWRVLVQQMAASLPCVNPLVQGKSAGVLSKGDFLWPALLAAAFVWLALFCLPRMKSRRVLPSLAFFGLCLWAGPACLLAVSARYQQPDAITWKWGYIPAAASSLGLALLLCALLAMLAGFLSDHTPKIVGVLVRLLLAGLFAVALTVSAAYTRGALRTHHAENLASYQFFARYVAAGIADDVGPEDLILTNERVWDGDAQSITNFFSRYAGRELHAQVRSDPLPADFAGEIYICETYAGYGGYDLAFCGKASPDAPDVMNGMKVYVRAAVPENAVLKYTVRTADGAEEARAVNLLDLDKTPRDANGDCFALVEDANIVAQKVMIWPG